MLSDDNLISSEPSIVIMLPLSYGRKDKQFLLRRAVKLTLLVVFWFTVVVVITFEAWLKICFNFILKSSFNCYWKLWNQDPINSVRQGKPKENSTAYTNASYQDFIILISRMSATKYNIMFQIINITKLETLYFINSFFCSFIHFFTPSFLLFLSLSFSFPLFHALTSLSWALLYKSLVSSEVSTSLCSNNLRLAVLDFS